MPQTPEEGVFEGVRDTCLRELHGWHGTCYHSRFVWLA